VRSTFACHEHSIEQRPPIAGVAYSDALAGLLGEPQPLALMPTGKADAGTETQKVAKVAKHNELKKAARAITRGPQLQPTTSTGL
jgi:hypothetical protein